MQPICDDFFKDLQLPSGPGSVHLNPAVRAYLAAAREYLLGLHDAGAPAQRVLEEHSDLTDRLVRKLFRLAEDRYFETNARLDYRLAVVAVGGYGRRELALASDIDLVFLHRGKSNPYVETLAEAITHRLWDARLVVGAATRTVAECLRVGSEDLATLTSYLDARFLIGGPELYAELEREVARHVREHAASFAAAKLAEQARRHERFGESLYLLQPNLRESVGGLRDYHTALWVARAVQWQVQRPRDLLVHGFIDEGEHADLMNALDFLWRVRNELHRRGRKDDRLHYEAQERLAAKLGFEATDDSLAVERLMRAYYVHARVVARVSRRVSDHAQVLLERARGRAEAPARMVSEGFAIAGHELEIPSATLLTERPVRLFAAFAVAQHHDVGISPRAQRLLRQHVHLIDDAFRQDREAARLFLDILSAPLRVYRSLALLDELGLLGAYIPEFSGIVGLWQQDMYHTYTVDVHSLFLVEQLRRLKRGRFRQELPLATELMREVRSPVVLFLACLLHDIGKGKGGGHSERGAAQVPAITERLGLGPVETEQVAFLVRHHLTLSAMAEQRNVHSGRVILRLARLTGSREQLRNLYLMTVADIRSVSPVAWTDWKAGLLEALYRNAAEWLEAGAEEAQADLFFLERTAQRLADRQERTLAALAEAGADVLRASDLLDSMPRRFLLNHPPFELAAHVRAALDYIDSGRRVGVYTFPPAEDRSFFGLVVFAPDQRGLFSNVAGVLTSLGHDILGAQVYTSRTSLAVDILQVAPRAAGPEEEEAERQRIEERLTAVLAGRQRLDPQRRVGQAPAAGRARPPRVGFTNEESDFHTIIDVHADDRPGLLYDITRTLAALGLDVVRANIATRARRVTDAFYVTDAGHKIQDAARREEIEARLLAVILPGAAA